MKTRSEGRLTMKESRRMLRVLYLLAALTIAVTILIANTREADKVQDYQAYSKQDLLKGCDPVK
jgi:type II secretory pathway component PulK